MTTDRAHKKEATVTTDSRNRHLGMEGTDMQVRQGDLLIEPISMMPKGAKQTEKTKLRILAYGEVTGHAHRLSAGTILELGGETFFSTDVETILSHDEHGPITFTPGVYKVTHQKEYSPDYGVIPVAD